MNAWWSRAVRTARVRASACGVLLSMYEAAVRVLGVERVLKRDIIRVHYGIWSGGAYVHAGKVRHKIISHKKEHEDVVVHQVLFYDGA